MSLSFLKTKDLTWQDRTVNVEVMLSPSRAQLLLNKHKTLTTSYSKEVDLYEKQVSSFVKDMTVKKRLMERYRLRLLNRKRELLLQGSHSARALSKVHEQLLFLYDERSRSAPAGSSRESSTPRPVGKRSRGLFLTEIKEATMSVLPALASRNSKQTKKTSLLMTLPAISLQPSLESSGTKTSLGPKPGRIVTFGEIPLPELPDINGSGDEGGGEEEEIVEPAHVLSGKIKTFLEDVKVFNKKPRSSKFSLTPDIDSTEGFFARNFNTVTISTDQLEHAFDSFCKIKSRENLTRMMRMASKMKANAVQARLSTSSSAVPTVGDVISSRTFLTVRHQVARPTNLRVQTGQSAMS